MILSHWKEQLTIALLSVVFLIVEITPDCSSPAFVNNAGCDPRCINATCDVLNSHYDCCLGCGNFTTPSYRQKDVDTTNNVWVYTVSNRCVEVCMAGQYPINQAATIGNICYECDRNCTTCTGPTNTQCTSCAPASYQLDQTKCYNMGPISSRHNPCPAPYYGLQITMTCQTCPTGCTSCNIFLQEFMPGPDYITTKSMNNIDCVGDTLCRYTLKCHSCSTGTGYFLEQGFCYKNQCRKYQIYTSTSGIFNSAFCKCITGYYEAGLTCSRCHYTCETCTSSAASACSTCPTGYVLSGATSGSCLAPATTLVMQDWVGSGTLSASSGSWTATPATSNINSCNGVNYVFGYYGYLNTTQQIIFPSNAKLSYSSSIYSDGLHYGLHFRATFIFIDSWPATQSITFTENGQEIYAYNFLLDDIKGQYLCGLNYHDHITMVDFYFSHTTTSVNIEFFASSSKYAWGVRDIIIEQLGCHQSCLKCDGPLQYNCTQCKAANNEVVVDGDCVCDIDNNYYLTLGVCSQSCPGSEFQDNTTRSCVAACSFPLMFHYNGQCYEQCPVAAPYRQVSNSYCVAVCFDPAQTDDTLNQYKFDGADKVCYNQCPNGMYGDPETGSCVSICPNTSSESDYATLGAFAQGKFCTQVCTGNNYAFPGTRQCVPDDCPTGYYRNTKDYGNGKGVEKVCEQICSVTLQGQKLYGDNSTMDCVDAIDCPADTYADQASNLCLQVCNQTAYKQTVGLLRTCVQLCDSVNQDIFGNNLTHICVVATSCPNNTYGDYQSTFCELGCTDISYFGDNTTRTCISSLCPEGFKQIDSKLCVATCPSLNNNDEGQFGDVAANGGYCVQDCTGLYFADNQTNRECVLTCAASPSSTFGLDNQCVFNCSSTTWADPFHVNRICTTQCTNNIATTLSYGNNETRMCVQVCPDTQYGQLHSVTGTALCVFVCQEERYGNPDTNLCVDHCPAPYYGDPTGNRTCNLDCLTSGYFALNLSAQGVDDRANRTCVQVCTFGWADNFTRMCAMTPFDCTQGLYAHQTNHKCVQAIDCTGFADPVTKNCVPTCFQNSTHKYFGNRDNHMCVQICPQVPDYFGDNTTNQCQLACTQSDQVRDIQNNRRCVLQNNCSRLPIAYFGDTTKATCVIPTNCTDDTYADNNTMMCQTDCDGTGQLHYADPVSRQCVSVCQLGYYGLNTTTDIGICSQTCPVPQWADNLTVRCETQCSALTYGVNLTNPLGGGEIGVCQSECPIGEFARDVDNLCVDNCGVDHWGQTQSRRCVTDPLDCPEGYYADNTTHMCVVSTDCSFVGGVQWVAQNTTKECMPGCPPLSQIHNYADMAKFLCVAVCPYNKFGNNNTLECQDECKTAGTFNGEYADPQLRICVQICSAQPIQTYGENDTYTCVEARYCPATTYAQDQYYDRVCVTRCPDPRVNSTFGHMFAYDITKKCQFACPGLYYGNIVNESHYGTCVTVCPAFNNGTLKFADNSTKLCVMVCPVGQATFGDPDTLRCVKKCPLGRYAQLLHSTLPARRCVQTCDTDTWSQTVKRTCVTDPNDCPTVNGFHWYAHNTSTSCVKQCPSGQDLWGENTTYICESACVSGSYKYTVSRVCIDQCPPSLDDDGLFSDQGMCYSLCQTAGYFRDVQNDRSCQPTCSFSPVKYYADDTTMRCVLTCPSYPEYYYAYDADKVCMTTCPLSTMKDYASKACVSTCPTSTFFDENSDACVEKCPSDYSISKIWYGDSTQTPPKCVQALDCPSSYYADDHVQLCVLACSENQMKYSKYCVTHCPDGYYSNFDTGFCVLPAACPTNYYANNQTRACVSICNGTFADKNNKLCVSVCPDSYFADPATRECSLSCTNNATISLIKNLDNKTCISQCAQQLFLNPDNNLCESSCNDGYYEDTTTQICVAVCPSVPPLYGQNDTNKCVQQCDNTLNEYKLQQDRVCVTTCPNSMLKNNHSRLCVEQCYNNTYADTQYCVYNCTPKYSLDDPNICTSACPSPYYKDPTTFKCVLQCPTSPQQYYKVVTATERKCDLSCPANQYRDDLTYSCVSVCPKSPPTFADATSGNCTAICSLGFYAYKVDRTCKNKCPDALLADPLSRTCVTRCTNKTDTYGDSTLAIPACVYLCSSGTFANPYTLKCASTCGTSPKTYGFDNTTHRICLQTCPYPYIADNSTQKCQLACMSTSYPYLDLSLKQCVSSCESPNYQYRYMPTSQTVNGTCETFCPDGYFALLSNNSCVVKCPDGLYGSKENNTCYENCTLANYIYTFADPVTNLCTDQCIKYNDTYDSFADLYSRECVPECPQDKHTIKDNNTRKCQPQCTLLTQYADWTTGYCVTGCSVNYYADAVTLQCVENCSLYSQRYIYQANRTCVTSCLSVGLFADDSTRTCVTALNCPDGYWGLISTGVCVDECPTTPDMFGDEVSKTCVSTCPNTTTISQNYYADFSTRQCVKTCPMIPALFARNDTRRCVQECPDNTYADNYTRRCVTDCSVIPSQTFTDNSTNRCVTVCPTQPNYFASNQTFECVFECTSSPKMYADYSTRTCVQDCPGGDINTYADQSTRFCVRLCPGLTYMENTTRTCQAICLTGFADPQTKLCIDVCPEYTYGHVGTGGNKTCKPQCPTESPAIYAQDATNLCVSACTLAHGTYRDPSSNRCVKICPIDQGYFADNSTNRICRDQCPDSFYADYSTRYCVAQCPETPALFAILDTRICTLQCPDQSWADNLTRKCVIDTCPDSPNDTYADNSTWTCVLTCPSLPIMTYADNSSRQCVTGCPSTPDYYADNNTGRCVLHCSQQTYADSNSRDCVETCPQGWYGVNSTWRCEQTCPDGQFADHLMNLCVAKCSVDPIFYGNPDTNICVDQCPLVNNSFGNPLSQQCVNYQLDGFSGCPDALFAENVSRLCTEVCPLKEDTYGDNSTWKCVDQCPAGADNTFSDNSTMRCVKECPSYPQYYAQEYSRRCVSLCLQSNTTYTGSFSDNSTRMCVQTCPTDPDYFSDNSTRRCVFYCPRNPLTFADNSTRRCVQVCPSTPDIYGDMSTQRCVEMCPEDQQTYADNSTRLCVKVCPVTPSMFAQNVTNRCVDVCPDFSFSDNSSRQCVAVCPQYPDTYGDPSTHRCVTKCPASPDLYADPISQECVTRCPDGYYAQNDTRRCLPDCPYDKVNYADNLTNKCVQKCPQSEKTYGDNSTQQCIEQCPLVPFTYADNMTRICLQICNNVTGGGYAQNETRVCVDKCPDDSYGDITTRYCVRYCPEGWYAYNQTNLCVQSCPEPYFADPTTQKCVKVCPVSQLLFGESIDRTCINSCPETTYADFDTQECVTRCPSKDDNLHAYDTFGYNDTNECLDECPIPLYGYPVDYVCVDVCPDPYYENITDHRCYKCPDECQTCNYPQACLTCIQDHYLHAGSCVQSCPTFPVITYANPNRQCGTSAQCTSGYFALNATKSCVKSCPSGYYKNNQAQSCSSCQRGCSTCTNSESCVLCNNTLAIWFEFKCYTYCSPLRRYYTDTGCVSTCPSGTFLSLTTCSKCSSICKTCVVQAENCKTCANGLYLSNNLCVQSCPTNYKAVVLDDSLQCKSCSVVDCTVQKLTYQLTQYVENFQYRIQMKFSETVNINGSLANIIAIKKKTNTRRVLATTYQLLDYTIIDYGNGLYEFILTNYDPETGAQFQVQILDPQAIRSLSGQLAQNTRATVLIDSTTAFSLKDYIEIFTIYSDIVIIISFVLLVMSFWTLPSIWFPMFDFLQVLFAIFLINVDLPPTAMLALAQFKSSTFSLLPNFYADFMPTPFYDKDIMSNSAYSIIRDLIFLRNMGQLYFIFLIVGILLIVTFLVGKKFFHKKTKKWAKRFFRETFWKKHLFNLVNILFLPVFLFGLLNFRDYQVQETVQGFSIFNSWLFMVAFIAVMVYVTYKLRVLSTNSPITYLMLQKAYNFITYQKIVLIDNENHHFITEKNEIDLKKGNYPKINELLIIPFVLETRMGPMQITAPIFLILYKFLIALFITIAYENSIIQIFFLILLNILLGIYIILKKPFMKVGWKQFTNQIIIHNLIILSIIQLIILAYATNINSTTMDIKNLIAIVIAVVLVYGITANLIYFIYRVHNYYFENVWKPFVETELFRDNYTIEYLELSKKYQDKENFLKKETRSRAEFLEAIKVEKGQALADMVLRDPNQSGIKEEFKQVKLRPSKTQQVRKGITQMFQTLHKQQQNSNKSVRSSDRLSKFQRDKVRKQLFSKVQQQKQDQYQQVKINTQIEQQEKKYRRKDQKNPTNQNKATNQYTSSNQKQKYEVTKDDIYKINEHQHQNQEQQEQTEQQDVEQDSSEYSFEYIDEQYPDGTPMQEIMRGCKKGDIVMP